MARGDGQTAVTVIGHVRGSAVGVTRDPYKKAYVFENENSVQTKFLDLRFFKFPRATHT
jgi:hypothetical protein